MSGSEASRRGQLPRRGVSVFVGLCVAMCLTTPAWATATITHIDVRPEAHQTVIAFSTDQEGAAEIKGFTLSEPPRLVFDLPGAELDPELPAVVELNTASIARIRFGQFSAEPFIARAVVDLSEDAPELAWEVVEGEDGTTLVVLPEVGLPVIGFPAVEQEEGTLLVRMPGAGKLEHSLGEVEDPPRLYIDLRNAVVKEHSERQYQQGALQRLRLGQQPPCGETAVARLVLELTEPQAHSDFAEGDDLIIALGARAWALPLGEYQPADRLKGRTIVVDPGHGGEDIGAPAIFGPPPRGPYEKDIVLDIAHRLAALLRAEGADVRMTRTDDTYVSLRERAALANRVKADALISIHCNSCDTPNTLHGTSVYYDHQHSEGFAQMVQQELMASLGTLDKGVRNANFAVIRHTSGPGILVETAYINHEGDRQRLVHPNFRERAARGMLRGLMRFLGVASEGDSGA
ncbi:MAG: N-acetylmuramoyl-L-alanine amidase [Armatimonadetes bacterium]|nr:N-acetylmuramoyl-L-alanine amidase [Armatimonadota bacterium]